MAVPLSELPRLRLQWEAAADRYCRMAQWREENPYPDWGAPEEAREQWRARCREAEERIGYRWDDGNIRQRRGAFSMRIRAPLLDDQGRITGGTWLVKCRCCEGVFATFDSNETTCCRACKDELQAAVREHRANRRRQRSEARAKVRAGRFGICVACGEVFRLQRITAKTCSSRCRVRLHRCPEILQRIPRPTPRPERLAALEAELRTQRAAELAVAYQRMRGETTLAPMPEADRPPLVLAIAAERRAQRLSRLLELAPALGLWVQQQDASTQRRILQRGPLGYDLLGPDLLRAAGVEDDADLGPIAWRDSAP